MILVVGGIKGGSGKTTIATNLAVISAHSGKKTLLVDADEQGSASDWAEQRDDFCRSKELEPMEWQGLEFPTIKLSGKLLYEQVKRMRPDYETIIIDVGGRDTTSQRSALLIADTFLVPFKPRSFDVWTIGKVKSLIEEVRTINQKIKVCVCINQADARGSDNDEAVKILEEDSFFNVIRLPIGYRKSFANAASQGLGVYELDRNERDVKAIQEMENCAKAVFDWMSDSHIDDVMLAHK
jgi:chromosome partitioning protein